MGTTVPHVKALSVHDLLNSQFGRLEIASNGFRWTKRQWLPFITHWLNRDEAFLGCFVVGQTETQPESFTVIDGAQRLMVIVLTLRLLHDTCRHRASYVEALRRSLTLVAFGSSPVGRVVARYPPEDNELHRIVVDGEAPAIRRRGEKRSKLAAAYRAMRRELEAKAAELASDEAQAKLVARALDGIVSLTVLRTTDVEAEISRHGTGPTMNRPPAQSVLRIPSGSDNQWDLMRRPPGTLPGLTPEATYAGTVWIPRILWALEFALRHGLGPQSASDIARTLHRHAFLAVANTNIARAFRHHRRDVECHRMWRETEPLKYEILSHGREVLAQSLSGKPP